MYIQTLGENCNQFKTLSKNNVFYSYYIYGYAPELPSGLLNLVDDQVFVYDFSAEEYYLYSETENVSCKNRPVITEK